MERPSWTRYFMDIAALAATRATCPRLRVGCVAVLEHRVVATGYNGALPGQAHCDDVGCDVADGHCQTTLHGEQNLIAYAARVGTSLQGADIYVTHLPCFLCAKLLFAAGIRSMYYAESYRPEPRMIRLATALSVAVVQVAANHA